MESIITKAEQEHTLDKEDIVKLLKSNTDDTEKLFKASDRVRQKFVGDAVHLRGLIEISNICKNNCFYCGIRAENKAIDRYRLSLEEILSSAYRAYEMGFKTIVLQGGEDSFFDEDKMSYLIKEIKKFDVAITLSLGEKSYDEYKKYKKAGADRYLLRIETTDKELYHKLHPKMSWENRKNCIFMLKELGFEIGSGSLVGLPEQSIDSLADDILFYQSIPLDMAGIGPFIPHPQTPLNSAIGGDFELSLKVMAITRLLLPDINIPATTAMETLRKEGRRIALQSGANVVMPNLTELEYRKKYELYPNKANTDNLSDIKEKILEMGRTIGKDIGSHKKSYEERKENK